MLLKELDFKTIFYKCINLNVKFKICIKYYVHRNASKSVQIKKMSSVILIIVSYITIIMLFAFFSTSKGTMYLLIFFSFRNSLHICFVMNRIDIFISFTFVKSFIFYVCLRIICQQKFL